MADSKSKAKKATNERKKSKKSREEKLAIALKRNIKLRKE